MSTELRKKVSKDLLDEEFVDPLEKKQALQTAIYDVSKANPFLGSVMQCLDIYYSHIVPRAGIMFDTDGKKWQMIVNPFWFAKKITKKNRKAVLLHEMYHITHKHPMRAPFLRLNEKRRRLMNIGMDMAINQYIVDLPNGCQQCPPIEMQMMGEECKNKMCPGSCIMLEDYFDIDQHGNKVAWKPRETMEYYYMQLIRRYDDSDNGGGGEGEGEPGGEGAGVPNDFDSHHWETNSEETEMLDATEELIKRAIQKRGLSYDDVPQFAKELLADIDARRAELNYRAIIQSAIKRKASGFNREQSWARPSRRWGNKAAGTRMGKLPSLANYTDTSGSISVQEANDNLAIIDELLRVGARSCHVGLWHTDLYYFEKYKLGNRFDKSAFQNGGTNVQPVIEHIIETEPDLAIIFTDGCFGDVAYENMLKPNVHMPQILWIISREGKEQHPLQRLGETIKIPETDYLGRDKRLEEQ